MTTTGSLGGAAARGAAKTFSGQIARLIITLAGIVVLVRLLEPSDYGLLTMVLAIIGVGEIFRDFGLSSAAIQSKTLSRGERDNLFWLNTFIGCVLALLVTGASFILPIIYDEPRLQAITAFLSITFVLNGVATQYRADLARSMHFGRLAIVELAGPLVGLVASLGMALTGFGYWSLVAQQLAAPLVSLILVVLFAGWMPGPPQRRVSIKRFVGFGANLLGVQLLTYASRNVDSIVIGTRFGPGALGIYDRAFQILALPLNQINAPATRVALPVLAKLQNQPDRFGAFLLRGQAALVYPLTGAFAFAAMNATPVVDLVLGSRWSAAVPIFQILAIGGVAQGVSYATYWVFLAHGLTASNLRYALVTRPLLVFAVLAGSHWGTIGVAWAYSAALLLFWPLGLWWISRLVDVPAMAMFSVGLRALVGFGVAGLVSWAVTWPLGLHSIAALAVALLVFVGFSTAEYGLWPAFRRDVRSVLDLRTELRRKR